MGKATTRRPNIPPAVRYAVINRDGLVCVLCGRGVRPNGGPGPDRLHLDHITPHSMGGPDSVDNLRVTCQTCNLARQTPRSGGVGGSATKWMTLDEAATYLNVHQKSIRRWIAAGRLPASRLGPRQIRIKSTDVDAMLKPIPTARLADWLDVEDAS